MFKLNNKGQSLVMLVIIVPIIILILTLVYDVGSAIYEKNNLAINFYKTEGFNIESKKIDKYTNEKELIMKWTKL